VYEILDHTADIGLHIEAGSLNELFAEAGRALMAVLVANPEAIEARQTEQVDVTAETLDYLLVDWLSLLLRRFELEGKLYQHFDVQVDTASTHLSATLQGEQLDLQRHRVEQEVKAVTYHNLTVQTGPDGRWTAEVILDV